MSNVLDALRQRGDWMSTPELEVYCTAKCGAAAILKTLYARKKVICKKIGTTNYWKIADGA
jgi:hypothetical protein